MNRMIWILGAVLAIIAILQFLASRAAYRKLNTLNEYVQFLLFHPQVYEDHRAKFLSFVSKNSNMSISDQTMASYRAIEDMAVKLEDKILLSNVISRRGSDDNSK